MALESFEKQNFEEFFIWGGFTHNAEDGEVIDAPASSVVAEDKDGIDKTSTVLDVATKAAYGDTKLKIRVKGGEEILSKYKITFYLVTSLGNKWEIDAHMKVKET